MRHYTINSVRVTRKDFFNSLKADCQRIASTVQVGALGVDIMEFDPEKYQRTLRNLQAGHMVLMQHSGKTYCSYRG